MKCHLFNMQTNRSSVEKISIPWCLCVMSCPLPCLTTEQWVAKAMSPVISLIRVDIASLSTRHLNTYQQSVIGLYADSARNDLIPSQQAEFEYLAWEYVARLWPSDVTPTTLIKIYRSMFPTEDTGPFTPYEAEWKDVYEALTWENKPSYEPFVMQCEGLLSEVR